MVTFFFFKSIAQDDRSFLATWYVLILLKMRLLILKTIRNRKTRLWVRLRSDDNYHLSKSADRKAQISPVSGTNAFLICAFWSADFLRWYLSSERNLTHNLFFLFPIVFSINLIHFFDEKKDGAARDSIVCLGASIPSSSHLAVAKRRVWILRRMELFRRVQRFWQRKVWTQRHLRGGN